VPELKAGGALPDDPELEAELTQVEYGFNARDELQLERKEDMKARGLASTRHRRRTGAHSSPTRWRAAGRACRSRGRWLVEHEYDVLGRGDEGD